MGDWTNEQDQLLEQILADGGSLREASDKLGRSRNACAGRSFRLGMRDDLPPITICHVKTLPKRQKTKPLPKLAPDCLGGVSLLELKPHHCRWPLPDGTFCGLDKIGLRGIPYCSSHAARAMRWWPGNQGRKDENQE